MGEIIYNLGMTLTLYVTLTLVATYLIYKLVKRVVRTKGKH